MASTRATSSTARTSPRPTTDPQRALLDADPERQPGVLDDDVPLAASLRHDVVDLDGVRTDLEADPLGRTGLPGRLAVDEHVVAILVLAAQDLDAGGSVGRRDFLERDLERAVAVDGGDVELVACEQQRDVVTIR